MKKLGDLAEIIVGQILTRVSGEGNDLAENTKILVPKAISEGGIIDENISNEYVMKKKADDSKYSREGDVVLKLATPYEAAYVDKDHEGYLIPSFCAALRAKDGVDPAYLCALVNSSYVREQINARVAGVVRPMVKVTDLRTVDVPDVPVATMKKLGEEYLLSGRKRRLLRQLGDIEKKIMDNKILGMVQEGK